MQTQPTTFTPCVLCLAGAPLHGKTTIAKMLANRSNLHAIDVDDIRHAALPKAFELQGGSFSGFEHNLMVTAYSTAAEFARRLIGAGQPVILSGPYSETEFKNPLRVLTGDLGNLVPFRFFRLNINSLEIIRQRIERRQAGGRPAVIATEEQYRRALEFQGDWWESAPLHEIDGSGTIEEVSGTILQLCHDLILSS